MPVGNLKTQGVWWYKILELAQDPVLEKGGEMEVQYFKSWGQATGLVLG